MDMATDMTTDKIAPEIGSEAPISALYRWSAWVHVGPGADTCEDIDEERGINTCSNPTHVHLWCRLPNQFQQREINERALAAKARRVRQLRSGDSDSAVILDEEMETLARLGNAAKDDLVDELVNRDWWRDHLAAVNEIKEAEDDDGAKLYEHIEADIERLAQIQEMPEDQQPAEELKELQAHYAGYEKAVLAAAEAEAKPRREALAARDVNDLIDMVRDQRIDVDSTESFSHTYAKLQWQLCTLKGVGGDRVWLTEADLEGADEAVIEAVAFTFQDLTKTQQGGGRGNS